MRNIKIIPFSSFLAGALLSKRDIPYLEFSMQWSDFQNKYNVEFMNESEDRNYAQVKCFFYENFGFHLNGQYADMVMFEGKKQTVYDCLYTFTNEFVREYFNLSKVMPENYKNDVDYSKKRRS